jgi:hypothetical protein
VQHEIHELRDAKIVDDHASNFPIVARALVAPASAGTRALEHDGEVLLLRPRIELEIPRREAVDPAVGQIRAAKIRARELRTLQVCFFEVCA